MTIHDDLAIAGKISNYSDRIDSREVLARIEELEEEHTDDNGDVSLVESWVPEARDEHAALTDLVTSLNDVAGYETHLSDGMFLVRESAWTEYVRDEWYPETYGGDLYTYDPNTFREVRLSWDDLMSRAPFNNIDWESAARDLETECSSVMWGDVSYVVS